MNVIIGFVGAEMVKRFRTPKTLNADDTRWRLSWMTLPHDLRAVAIRYRMPFAFPQESAFPSPEALSAQQLKVRYYENLTTGAA